MRFRLASLFMIAALGAQGAASSYSAPPSEQTERLTEEHVEKAEAYLGLAKQPSITEHTVGRDAVAKVVRNIGGVPEDSPVKIKAIALARKYAAIPEYAVDRLDKQRRPDNVDDRQAHNRLGFAWKVLRETGVLRTGLRLEDLVGFLGQPTEVRPELAEWYYASPMHVNPCLRYWRADGNEKKGQIEIIQK